MPDFAPLSTAKRLLTGGSAQPAAVGRFELRRLLGKGAQASVWLAHDPRLQREVAIKLLPPVQGQGAAAVLEHWLREARHVGRLAHPHIVPVFEADVQGQQPYIVFEYVPGCTLAEHLERQGRCAPHDAVSLVVDVLDGLQAWQASGLKMGVVTNKPVRFAEPIMQQLGLASRSALLICPDHVKNTKPDPEPMRLACQQLGLQPQEIQSGELRAHHSAFAALRAGLQRVGMGRLCRVRRRCAGSGGLPREQPVPAAGQPGLPAVLRFPLWLGLGQL